MRIMVSIKGLQEFQKANVRMLRAVKPSGAMGRTVKRNIQDSFKLLYARIHVQTGAAKGAIRMAYRETSNQAEGRVYFDTSARNPRGKIHRTVVSYIGSEFGRGGAHDAWGMMLNAANGTVFDIGVSAIFQELRDA